MTSQVNVHLATMRGRFRVAAAGEADALFAAAQGLRTLFAAGACLDNETADMADVDLAIEAIRAARFPIADSAAPDLMLERVLIGLEIAVAFLQNFTVAPGAEEPREILYERAHHIGLLASELETIFHRRQLAAGGGALNRLASIRHAARVPADPGALLH